jgi:hypothetical protein
LTLLVSGDVPAAAYSVSLGNPPRKGKIAVTFERGHQSRELAGSKSLDGGAARHRVGRFETTVAVAPKGNEWSMRSPPAWLRSTSRHLCGLTLALQQVVARGVAFYDEAI